MKQEFAFGCRILQDESATVPSAGAQVLYRYGITCYKSYKAFVLCNHINAILALPLVVLHNEEINRVESEMQTLNLCNLWLVMHIISISSLRVILAMRYDGVIDHRGNRSRRVIVNFYRVFEAPVICVFLIDNGRRSEAGARACILILLLCLPSSLERAGCRALVAPSPSIYTLFVKEFRLK